MLLRCNIPATILLYGLQSFIRPTIEFMNVQIERLVILIVASSDRHTTRDACATKKFRLYAKSTVIQDTCTFQTDYK